jgi:hypothetical protein
MEQRETNQGRGEQVREDVRADEDQAREMADRHRQAVEKGEIPGENEAAKDLWWVKGERAEDASAKGGSESG